MLDLADEIISFFIYLYITVGTHFVLTKGEEHYLCCNFSIK